MKDFMNVRQHPSPLLSLHNMTVYSQTCVRADVLEPSAALLQRLRDGLHVQELAGQGGRVRDAVRGQVPQELGEVGGAVPGAECANGAAGWDEYE